MNIEFVLLQGRFFYNKTSSFFNRLHLLLVDINSEFLYVG